jgi:hypothetical protein
MSEDKPITPAEPPPKPQDDRETRLATALRANLRRRKVRPAGD